MPSLQIREFPAPLYDILSLKAQEHHRSLTQQAIAELELALLPQGQGYKRLQTLQKLRASASGSGTQIAALHVGEQLEQWQRLDRER